MKKLRNDMVLKLDLLITLFSRLMSQSNKDTLNRNKVSNHSNKNIRTLKNIGCLHRR